MLGYDVRKSRLLVTLRSNDATATRTSLKKRICVLSVLYRDNSYLLTLSNVRREPPDLEFQGTIFKFRNRNKISSFLVYEIWHIHVVIVQKRQRNVQKKRDARAKLLFCLLRF